MNLFSRLFLIFVFTFSTHINANVLTTNTWTITSSSNTGATGTVTDASLPGFSADFTIVRSDVVSFGAATWTAGNQINVLNAPAGASNGTDDSIQLEISFSNIVGGTIDNIISEFGTTTNNDINATWTYTWASGGNATLLDPDSQMVEADNTIFTTGGLVTNATNELSAASHTWCVTIPTNSVTLDWASNTHAFAEAMSFRIQVAELVPTSVPTLSTWALFTLMSIFGFIGLYFSGRESWK